MKISYDAEVDALSITFCETTTTIKHLAKGIAADYDSEGCLAGLEILERLWCSEHNQFGERLSADRHADAGLGYVGVPNELAALVNLALTIRAADADSAFADGWEDRIAV